MESPVDDTDIPLDDHDLPAFLHQSTHWISRGGYVKIAEMDARHRVNAANYLLKKAGAFAQHYLAVGEEIPSAREVFTTLGGPQHWIRKTPLYKSLMAGLSPAMVDFPWPSNE